MVDLVNYEPESLNFSGPSLTKREIKIPMKAKNFGFVPALDDCVSATQPGYELELEKAKVRTRGPRNNAGPAL